MATALSLLRKDNLKCGADLNDCQHLKIGIATSQWNHQITNRLKKGAVAVLKQYGLPQAALIAIEVPGSFELIFGAKILLAKKPDAIIAIGSIIKGATDHFHYVCQAVSSGIKDLNIKYNIPIIFCVLTDDNQEQALERSGGKLGNKGEEAAKAALWMAKLNRKTMSCFN